MSEETHFEEIEKDLERSKSESPQGLKKRRLIYLGICVTTSVFNIIFGTINQGKLKYMLPHDGIWSMFTFGTAFYGFGLALIFSLIPRKGTKYKHRYLGTALLICCLINLFFVLTMVSGVVRN